MTIDLRLLALRSENPTVSVPDQSATSDQSAGRPHSDVEALKDGAALLTQAGNRVAALSLLWSAVALDPVDLGAHRRLAAMLANAGDAAGAANEYGRYIDFVLPLGDIGRAVTELTYGVRMLGGHPMLRDAAEKIAFAVRALVPALPAPAVEPEPLPAPRLLRKVPFRFCIHEDDRSHWLQLEGGDAKLAPAAVRLVDGADTVLDTRRCIALAPGQKGHAPTTDGEPAGVAWAVFGIPDELVAALDAGSIQPYRVEALVGDDWLSTTLDATGCRTGRRTQRIAASSS